MEFTVAVSENDHRSCRPHGQAAVAYIAAESILPIVSHVCDELLPSKWSVACAITKSTVDIGRRAAGQINTSIYRPLIQTTHTCSLSLRFPKMVTAAVVRMVDTLVRANRVPCRRVIIYRGTINNSKFAAVVSTPT